MAGDYTRFTFDPTKGFSGVLKQQGRVSLDSDANEFEEILDRRDRAEMYDTVGQAVYPIATTPDAFKIAVDAGGNLTIGQGRLYIDGILAECFGDMTDPSKATFDANMNDLVGNSPLLYGQQPFLYVQPPAAAPFPALSTTAGATNLVYLDVWQREVTVFEDYSLREVALNGPDTDTRVQTAWQVKALDAQGATTCASVAGWAALIAPSSARMTATATPAAPAPGPCIISPAGGYTGLENRLYRVEIHKSGTVDGATKALFKWSRDNASLAARILSTTKISINKWVVTVGSTGRDSWMRFEFGDHVELLDDSIEFAMRESGVGGILAKVTNVNHATGEIEVDQDLTQLPIVASRHPRIRRWDFASAAEPLARDTNNGAAIALEDGISITFGLNAADTLHAGDNWVFAARTADGSIDSLDRQPPRNILHHFAKLALVTSGSPPVVTSDCRNPWPPPATTGTAGEACCTVVVRPGESIQAAIDSLPPAGGCVCLKAGVHAITASLTISGSGVILHGESPGVYVTAAGLPLMLQIAGSDVEVAMIKFVLSRDAADPVIVDVGRCARVRILQCGMLFNGEKPNVTGIRVSGAEDVEIHSNDIERCYLGIHAIRADRLLITENRLVGMLNGSGASGYPLSWCGVSTEGRSKVVCRGNDIANCLTGVLLANDVVATVVDNDISRAAMPAALDGPQPPEKMYYAIDVQSDGCRIDGNRIDLAAQVFGGVRITGRHNEVTGNRFGSVYPVPPGRGPIGVVAGTIEVGTTDHADFGNVAHNHFTGSQIAVFASRSRALHISGNTIVGVERRGFGIWIDYCEEALVSSNQVHDVMLPLTITNGQSNRVIDNVVAMGVVGSLIKNEEALNFSGNQIEDTTLFGVGVGGVGASNRFAHNRVAHCAYAATDVAVAISIVDDEADSDVTIESCEIVNTGVSPDHTKTTPAAALGILVTRAATFELANNRIVYEGRNGLDPNLEHRAVHVFGGSLTVGQGGAIISGNVFQGPGNTHLVEVSPITPDVWFKGLTFANNRCEHATVADDKKSTVILFAGHLIVASNHVRAPRGVPSINLNGLPGTTLGNCTSGSIVNAIATTPLLPSWTAFNLQNIP